MAKHVAPPTGLNAREPAAVAGTITALVAAVIALVVAFGVELTDDQQTAILGVVSVVAPIVAALLIRPQVYPQGKVVASVDKGGQVLAGPASPLPTGEQVDVVEYYNPMDGPARMDLDL